MELAIPHRALGYLDTHCENLAGFNEISRRWFEMIRNSPSYTTEFYTDMSTTHSSRMVMRVLSKSAKFYKGKCDNSPELRNYCDALNIQDLFSFIADFHHDGGNELSYVLCGPAEKLAPIGIAVNETAKNEQDVPRFLIASVGGWSPLLNQTIVANSLIRDYLDLNPWNLPGQGSRCVFLFGYLIHDPSTDTIYSRERLHNTIHCRVTLAEVVMTVKLAYIEGLSLYYLGDFMHETGYDTENSDPLHVYSFKKPSDDSSDGNGTMLDIWGESGLWTPTSASESTVILPDADNDDGWQDTLLDSEYENHVVL